VFLLVPAHPGSPGQRAVKRLLLLCVSSIGGLGEKHQMAQENGAQMAT